jgi:hypothetical protein
LWHSAGFTFVGGDADRPRRDARATVTCLDVRYGVREPDSRRVWKAWAFAFRANLTADELYGWLASLH